MAKKFIVNDGQIILGDVKHHSLLVRDHSKTKGGGYWFFDHVTDTMYLYGSSLDYGAVTQLQLESSTCSSLEGKTIIWASAPTLAEALKSTITIILKK